jgi:hypothetical protein
MFQYGGEIIIIIDAIINERIITGQELIRIMDTTIRVVVSICLVILILICQFLVIVI